MTSEFYEALLKGLADEGSCVEATLVALLRGHAMYIHRAISILYSAFIREAPRRVCAVRMSSPACSRSSGSLGAWPWSAIYIHKAI